MADDTLWKWATLTEDADTEWARGYDAARRYVLMQLNAATLADVRDTPFVDAAFVRLNGLPKEWAGKRVALLLEHTEQPNARNRRRRDV